MLNSKRKEGKERGRSSSREGAAHAWLCQACVCVAMSSMHDYVKHAWLCMSSMHGCDSAVTLAAMKAFLRKNVAKIQMPRTAIHAKRADLLAFLKAGPPSRSGHQKSRCLVCSSHTTVISMLQGWPCPSRHVSFATMHHLPGLLSSHLQHRRHRKSVQVLLRIQMTS